MVVISVKLKQIPVKLPLTEALYLARHVEVLRQQVYNLILAKSVVFLYLQTNVVPLSKDPFDGIDLNSW